ncbi:hypothetical protein TNCV_3467941 [Trichonephila clavipes]|nr:hypothetical protein TNCV_3467941 [Trichonephila clavipes]
MFYRPFENSTELNRMSPVWCSRQRPMTGVHQPIVTMNFVDLDLTMSDRWHEQQQQKKLFKKQCSVPQVHENDSQNERITHKITFPATLHSRSGPVAPS